MDQISKINYIHDLLIKKQMSCEEITKKYLEAIDTHNKELNAYITITEDKALESAKRIDKKISLGEDISMIAGIPMTIKDNISTKGILTSCASKMLSNYIPIYNATVFNLLNDNGSILLGKTNMDEFAMGSTSETSYYGAISNPHNLECVPGGSSGGGAAAVAGNIAVYALGSDTGGSIRQPASFCGVVGFKPTYGTVSRYGLVAFASSLDQIGPITTSVEDASIVYDVISEYDPKDSTSRGRNQEITFSLLKNSIKGKKIGIVDDFFEYTNDSIKEHIEQAIKVYEAMGAEMVHIKMRSIKYALPVYYILACAEASSNLGRYDGVRYGYRTTEYRNIDEMICKTRDEGFGKEVKHRILLGTYVLSSGYCDEYYKKAQKMRGIIIDDFKEAFKLCDALIAPTAPKTAFIKNYMSKDPMEAYANDVCTVPANIAGLPAISLPCGVDKDGLPIGIQIIGNRFCDGEILNIAYAYEQETKDTSFKSVNMGVRL